MPSRKENDFLGEVEIPETAFWGVHTYRALANFSVSDRKIPAPLIHAYGEVKLACAKVNTDLGYLEKRIGEAIQKAAKEVADGVWDDQVVVDAFQGGAGTSTNLNISEIIANRTLEIIGKNKGDYSFCDPIMHVNLHQSTNDTYPTALHIAVFRELKRLEAAMTQLQEALQSKEKEFDAIVKIGRTELMDAIPMTLGKSFGAWAEAFSRDRWRVFKCTERVRVINLGGTAIGTGMTAPRGYIFRVTDELRAITQLPLARAENLVEATQNQDVFVEIMGMLKAHAVNIIKMAGDLRLLNMGPDCGLGEIVLPAIQTGSSIMPSKINPVIPEMLTQIGIQVSACDQAVTWAAASGQLELNAFLPILGLNLLDALHWLERGAVLATQRCINGIQAQTARCRHLVDKSRMRVTALIPLIGYRQAHAIAEAMEREQWTLEEAAFKVAGLGPETLQAVMRPEAVNRLGFEVKRAGQEPIDSEEKT